MTDSLGGGAAQLPPIREGGEMKIVIPPPLLVSTHRLFSSSRVKQSDSWIAFLPRSLNLSLFLPRESGLWRTQPQYVKIRSLEVITTTRGRRDKLISRAKKKCVGKERRKKKKEEAETFPPPSLWAKLARPNKGRFSSSCSAPDAGKKFSANFH